MCLARSATGKVEGGGGFEGSGGKIFYKQMTRRHCILMSKNGVAKINIHQKEQQRNESGIERAKES